MAGEQAVFIGDRRCFVGASFVQRGREGASVLPK